MANLFSRYVLIFASVFVWIAQGHSQIVHDGTLGPAGPLSGPDFKIKAEAGKIVGTNLFHSFSDFNLKTGESATFSGPDSIFSIFSRVTGKDISVINGLIRSTVNEADMFLINPNGMMFGPNAEIDVSGSFTATTSAVISFADHSRFYASVSGDDILTTAAPAAFGFLGGTPGITIIENSMINAAENKAFSIVSGDIKISASHIRAPGGSINLISAGSPGEIIMKTDNAIKMSQSSTVMKMGEITLSGGSILDVDHDRGGTIYIRGNRLIMDDVFISADNISGIHDIAVDIAISSGIIQNNAVISSENSGSAHAGSILIQTDAYHIINGSTVRTTALAAGNAADIAITTTTLTIDGGGSDFFTGIESSAGQQGKGGQIVLNTSILDIIDDAAVISTTDTGGDGGDIIVNAETISLDAAGSDFTTGITAITRGIDHGGDNGDIIINSDRLRITGGAEISASTYGSGAGGSIAITAENIVLSRNQSQNSTGIFNETQLETGGGMGGDITITTENLRIRKGANISSSTFGDGDAGKIRVSGRRITIAAENSSFFTGITANTTGKTDGGNGGQIQIQTSSLKLTGGGSLSALSNGSGKVGTIRVDAKDILISGERSDSLAGIYALALDQNNESNGEDITIVAEAVKLTDDAVISSAGIGAGDTGNIMITLGNLILTGNAIIESTNFGPGNSGFISINSNHGVILRNSVISTAALLADSGAININAGRFIDLKNSSISSRNNLDGGDIVLNARERIQLIDSRVTTASGRNGGNISIDPVAVIIDSSRIIANSSFAQGGNISIIAELFLPTPDSIIDASSELGIAGNIHILSPDDNAAASLEVLPANTLDSELMLHRRCEIYSDEDFSSLTVSGRGGMPLSPSGFIPAYHISDTIEDENND